MTVSSPPAEEWKWLSLGDGIWEGLLVQQFGISVDASMRNFHCLISLELAVQ